MHRWGDDFKYFEDVDQAAHYIGNFCRRWGRISVRSTKEKYGTARVYCSFGFYGFYNIVKPGYVYCSWPRWLFSLDLKYGYEIVSRFNPIVVRYQVMIYRIAYKKAIKKYPHIKNEILDGADYTEYLKGL